MAASNDILDHELVNDLASAYRGKRMRDGIRDMEMAGMPEEVAERFYDALGEHADKVRGELHELIEKTATCGCGCGSECPCMKEKVASRFLTSALRKPLFILENKQDGFEVHVVQYGEKFHVVLFDPEAEEYSPSPRIYPTLERAEAEAKKIIRGDGPGHVRMAGKAKFPEVAKSIVAYLKKGPFSSTYLRVKSARGNKIVLTTSLNDQVDRVEISNLDQEKATFEVFLKNGDSGWAWDEYRQPPKFHNDPGYNVLHLDRLDRIANPTVEPDKFDQHMESFGKTLCGVVQKAGWVIDPKTRKPMKLADWAEKVRLETEARLQAEKVQPRNSLDDVTSRLRSIRLGPAGRVRSIDRVSPTEWTIEPTNRQRLDHYVGTGWDSRRDEDDDPEGWDSDAWEEDYANPVWEAAQKWLDEEFGRGILEVDEVGDKGHVFLSLTPDGKKHFGV